MIQVTLVALYGEKNPELAALIAQCQKLAADQLGDAFTPYDARQIHATIVGLERRIGSATHNANYSKHRGRDAAMDFGGFLHYLRGCGHFPFQVQAGGFGRREYPFRSRKAAPYERSFSVQGDKAVVMGWPVRGEPLTTPPSTPEGCAQEGRIYPLTLDSLRRGAQGFGILHAYHQTPTDVDNDLFFRIGLVSPAAMGHGAAGSLVREVRQILSDGPPLVVEMTLDDVYIAAYEDDKLPIDSTQVWSVADRNTSAELVSGLFR
jgi:hypothetical protein